MDPVSVAQFEEMVDAALDSLPDHIADMLDNVAVQVEDDHPEGLLGLYEGIPLTERDDYGAGMELPDVVTVFRLPLCDHAADLENLREEVRVTVVHELAHHLGIDDDRLHELGWA